MKNLLSKICDTSVLVKLKNLPIKVKLLSSLMLIALLPLAMRFLITQNINDLSSSFNKIVTQSYPQMEELFELKNASTQIQILTASFILQKGESTQVEGSRAANLKYELLSRLSELDKWLNSYSKTESDKKTLSSVMSELNTNKDKVMLSALKVIELYENNAPESQIEKQRINLNMAETMLTEQITEILSKKTSDLQIKAQHAQEILHKNFFITNIFFFLLIFLAIGLSILLVKIIASPIIRLRDFAQSIKSLDVAQHITINTNDEIGQLGNSLNRMIQRLYQLNKAVIDTAHQAGMAKVASSVLHNVGNVLNSMNVSTQTINDKIQQIKVQELTELISFLQDHSNELGPFSTDNPKGKLVITYLSQLSDCWQKELAAITDESELLIKNIAHIKTVISAQQSMSKVGGIIEPVKISELFTNILSIHRDLLQSHSINVENNSIPSEVQLDRIKVEQILINLVRNAIDALLKNKTSDKNLILHASISEDKNILIIQISDNGEGISEENLSKIFNFGFTTKKTGHGFGLHSCAISASEMGGTLTATSEGPKKGSTFTLTIPIFSKNKPSHEIGST